MDYFLIAGRFEHVQVTAIHGIYLIQSQHLPGSGVHGGDDVLGVDGDHTCGDVVQYGFNIMFSGFQFRGFLVDILAALLKVGNHLVERFDKETQFI